MRPPGAAEVVVIGGGPAGASAARELARQGIDTVLLEQTDGRGSALGECLAPSATPLLRRLGLDHVVPASGAVPSYGNRSAWGGDGVPADHDFLRDVFGHGWHLDRMAFNRLLLDDAAAAGVTVLRETRLHSLQRSPDGWSLSVAAPDEERQLAATMLVDASGRRAIVARREQIRRHAIDSLVAVVGCLDQVDRAIPIRDTTTIIEATEDGWWYAALVPNQRLVVTWFTDPDLLAARAAWRPANWWSGLLRTELIHPFVADHGFGGPRRISIAPAGSSLLAQPCGEGWIAAGDAAAAYDPLSSHGIGSALAGGRAAADVLVAGLGGDQAAATRYRDQLRGDFAHYLWRRHEYYALEQRWPAARFWRRRHRQARVLKHGASDSPITTIGNG